jgi:TM2 domain-containing membrane protein YozV
MDNGGCTVFGCTSAPADETKVNVAAPDLRLSTEHYAWPAKSRTAFIFFGILLGAFGAHNFYAGYTGKAVAQLCLTLLSFFVLSPVSYIWAIVDICAIDHDSSNILMT